MLDTTVIEQDSIRYLLNYKEKTACITRNYSKRVKIIIPRSIEYKSAEYIIKSINKYAFYGNKELKSIEFANDSEIEIIGNEVFNKSEIEYLTIPSSIIDLESGWCYGAEKLKTIKISPNNPKYILYQDSFILTKSNPEKENDDVLILCLKDIQEVMIPDFIEIIGSFSFSNCKNIQKVEFSSNSKLRIIENCAFFNSSIQSLTIPLHFNEFKKGWCKGIKYLTNFNITENNTNFLNYENRFILTKSTPEKEKYDVLLFSVRDITVATIPSFIEIIGPYAFQNCKCLQKVKFETQFFFFTKSNLRIIDDYSFSKTMIENFSIPSHVIKIGQCAFLDCKILKKVEIPTDSKLQTIEKHAFNGTSIENLTIPPNLIELNEGFYASNKSLNISIMPNCKNFMNYNSEFILGKSNPTNENFDVIVYCLSKKSKIIIPNFIEIIGPNSFCNKLNLQHIEFSSDSKLRIIEKNAFSNTSITRILIPSNVIKIGENAFFTCFHLIRVDFQQNSQLKIIEKCAFSGSSITKITIPSNVIKIEDGSFAYCKNLRIVEFSPGSNLEKINLSTFSLSPFQKVSIPSSVKIICNGSFSDCKKLQQIEIPNDSKLQKIESLAFRATLIEQLTIPSNFVEFEEGWCRDTCNLFNININPKNKFFISYDNNKLILSKSNNESENFDVLVFCSRDVKTIAIPKFIKIIESYAFEKCQSLQKVEIPFDSKLCRINKFAFAYTKIKSISFPSSVTIINEFTFAYNDCLEYISFNENSKLQKICDNVFYDASIKSIYIPSNVTKIDEYAFDCCAQLQILEFNENLMKILHINFHNCKDLLLMIPNN